MAEPAAVDTAAIRAMFPHAHGLLRAQVFAALDALDAARAELAGAREEGDKLCDLLNRTEKDAAATREALAFARLDNADLAAMKITATHDEAVRQVAAVRVWAEKAWPREFHRYGDYPVELFAALDGPAPVPAAFDRRDEHGKLPEDYEYGDDGYGWPR